MSATTGGQEAHGGTEHNRRSSQTPQVFRRSLYAKALAKAAADGTDYTDDCQLVEALGVQVYMTRGDYANIKLTTPEDFAVAEALLRAASERSSI